MDTIKNQIDQLTETALAIKAERDRLRAALIMAERTLSRCALTDQHPAHCDFMTKQSIRLQCEKALREIENTLLEPVPRIPGTFTRLALGGVK